MPDERPKVLVCMRVSDGPASVPSTTLVCRTCGERVWASLRVRVDPEVRALPAECIQCAYPEGPPTLRDVLEQVRKGDVEVHPIIAAEVTEFITGKKKEVGHD